MKTLLAWLLATSVCVSAFAQDFEGTLRWTFAVDITDPAMKQQMAEAQKQMADPEMQAKMKEAQAAMASPEMQAMMAQNPQMKAMMDKQLAVMNSAAASGGNPLANMFPRGITVKTKATDMLTVVEGGSGPSETLVLGATNKTYTIDRKARTYSVLPSAKKADASTKPVFTVKKTSETAVILGHACTKYLVSGTTGDTPSNYIVWAASDFKGFDSSTLSKLRMSQDSSSEFLSQIEGVPLKIEIASPQAKITMTAVSIKAESLSATIFQLPAAFTETPAKAY
jgi:hypothetical protein